MQTTLRILVTTAILQPPSSLTIHKSTIHPIPFLLVILLRDLLPLLNLVPLLLCEIRPIKRTRPP